ncbi:MAG: PqqD family protein [Gallionellaceae bacterium]|nr:PqqD family protein [Gallionellaceae bacterium]
MLLTNNAQISAETFETEIVVIHFLRGTYFSLRGAAMALWQWLQAGADEVTLAELLAERYGLDPERSRAEVAATLARLGECELVVESDQAAPGRAGYDMTAGPALFEAAVVEAFEDLQELIAIDPVHEVDPMQGWPHRPAPVQLD